MIEKEIPNLLLAAENAGIYSQVDGLSLQNLFYVYNKFFPNCYMFTSQGREGNFYFDTKNLLPALEAMYGKENVQTIQYITEDVSRKILYMGFCIVIPSKNIFARIERSIGESYVLFDNSNYESVVEFKDKLFEFYLPEANERNNFFTISSDAHGFDLVKNPVREVKDFNLAKQFNDDFVDADKKIQEFIKKSGESGIIMLHGTKGTGKTTYIRHLINTNPEKRFVFVPAGLIEMLGQPQFQSFLLTLTNHVIILEDCESALKDRKTNIMGASTVSILLNMSDGLLSDGLGIKFICTFNEDIKDMDEAITRKGRLMVKYEFKALNVEKSNALLKEVFVRKGEDGQRLIIDDETGEVSALYIGETGNIEEETENIYRSEDTVVYRNEDIPTTTKPMTLADIYNYDEESYESARKKII